MKTLFIRLSIASLVIWMTAVTTEAQTPMGGGPPTSASGGGFSWCMDSRTTIDAIPYVITSPGVYVLRRNLQIGAADLGFDGLTILSSDVVVDLGGFRLQGRTGSQTGIRLLDGIRNVHVYNGTVLDWDGNGLDAPAATDSSFTDLRFVSIGDDPIADVTVIAGPRSSVVRCQASQSSGTAFDVRPDSRVVDCQAALSGMTGFLVRSGSVVSGCVASQNSQAGLGGYGFDLGNGCSLENSSAISNGADGVNSSQSRITDCVAFGNAGNGFRSAPPRLNLYNGCLSKGNGTDTIGTAQDGVFNCF